MERSSGITESLAEAGTVPYLLCVKSDILLLILPSWHDISVSEIKSADTCTFGTSVWECRPGNTKLMHTSILPLRNKDVRFQVLTALHPRRLNLMIYADIVVYNPSEYKVYCFSDMHVRGVVRSTDLLDCLRAGTSLNRTQISGKYYLQMFFLSKEYRTSWLSN
jgi:hypothetical protein